MLTIFSPRKALQPMSANTAIPTRPQTPTTPTKPTPSKASPQSPTNSLANRYVHLEGQHQALQKEYEKIRGAYARDLKHWKEYKALEIARAEVKRQKKMNRKLAPQREWERINGNTPQPGNITLRPASAIGVPWVEKAPQAVQQNADLHCPLSQGSDPASQTGGKLVSASEDSQSLQKPPARESTTREERKTSVTVDETDNEENAGLEDDYEDDEVVYPELVQQPLVGDAAIGSHQAAIDPRGLQAGPSPTKERLESLMRNGHWLGGHGSDLSTTPQATNTGNKTRRFQSILLDNMDAEHATPKSVGASHAAARTPLIRDRGPGPSTVPHKATAMASAVVAPDSIQRKRGDLNNLTPSQKTRELKRLSSMSAVEKREYYAEYKGKGRYVAPEDLSVFPLPYRVPLC